MKNVDFGILIAVLHILTYYIVENVFLLIFAGLWFIVAIFGHFVDKSYREFEYTKFKIIVSSLDRIGLLLKQMSLLQKIQLSQNPKTKKIIKEMEEIYGRKNFETT